jgi:hypothetical protein
MVLQVKIYLIQFFAHFLRFQFERCVIEAEGNTRKSFHSNSSNGAYGKAKKEENF